MTSHINRSTKAVVAVALSCSFGPWADALEIDTGSDVKLRWDTTVKYSLAYRLRNPAAEFLANPDTDDGDRNFQHGPISNRLDLLSEMDLRKGPFGARVSGAGWYDRVYNVETDNDSASTSNRFDSADYRRVPDATRKLHGRKAELLDAFVFVNTSLGDMPVTARLGQHTVIFGEALFFPTNGIAYANAPLDLIKASSVPSTLAKELFMPVNQISGQIQPLSNLSVSAYLQLDWKPNRVPAAGSFWDPFDFVGDGAERFYGFGQLPPAVYLRKTSDITAKNSGQGGAAVRWRPADGDWELGFYAARYHDKFPRYYIRPTDGTYTQVYHEGVRMFGVSATTNLAGINFGAELHARRNTPLASNPATDTAGDGNNNSNPLYAIGNSLHAQLSAIVVGSKTALWDSSSFAGEIAWNRLTAITRNPEAYDITAYRNAWGVRGVFTPQYLQAFPGWDLSFPLAVGYNPKGKSSVVPNFNGGFDRGGDYSIGVSGDYLGRYKFALNVTQFMGSVNNTNAVRDRDNISFTMQTTF